MNVMSNARWMKKDIHAFLSKGRWFGALPETMREAILERSETARFQANTTFYKFGDAADGLYAALEGDIRAYAMGDDGERIFFRALGPGSWFGDAALLFGPLMRPLEVRCVSPATALFLSEQAYRELTESDPKIYRAFVQLVGLQMRHAMRVFIETRSEAPRRTARELLRLCRAHGLPTPDGTRLAMNLSQADLASLVGVSRQYMNELIARWEEEGVLRWNGKAQPLLNADRLRTHLTPQDAWILDNEGWM
jgi:CRP/FNR family transcriptional regulator, cyclic AMP receptor protein